MIKTCAVGMQKKEVVDSLKMPTMKRDKEDPAIRTELPFMLHTYTNQ